MLSLKNHTGLSEITKPDQDQNMQNHEETHSEPEMIDVVEVRQREVRDEWVIAIRDKLEQAQRDDDKTIRGKLRMYRVPHHLRDDDSFYVPQIVSLGPYHNGRKYLLSMERHKWRALNTVLQRTNHNIETYIDAMRELEEKARACYEGEINLNTYEFLEMLVLDGCFVLEFFKGTEEGFQEIGYARSDPVFSIPGFILPIQQDMLLLENQLPLFVLNRLLELQLGTRGQTGILAELAIRFFQPLMPTFKEITKPYHSKLMNWMEKPFDSLGDEGELHCLDIFRRSLLQSTLTPPTFRQRIITREMTMVKRQYETVKCVTELRYAGIKFMRKKTDRFWDIELKKGYLKIPRLIIHNGTKSLFSSLIAFEQCHIDSTNIVTSYMIFMENLISSNEDVSYLQDCGIIEHGLESDSDVVDMFKRVRKVVVPQESYLSRLSYEVNSFHKKNAYKATLRHKYLDTLRERYFNNPWAYLPFIAAVLLLVLTFTQTFFTVYPYYNPRS